MGAGAPTVFPTFPPTAEIILNVSNITDGSPVTTDCYPISSSSCNIRSAWTSCQKVSNSSIKCIVDMLPNMVTNFSSVYGFLLMNETNNIEIRGHNSTILSYPKEEGGGGGDSPVTLDPYSFSVSNTYYATTNYDEFCFTASAEEKSRNF